MREYENEEGRRFDLSRIRHDLRTPINHIIGYCEMLQEEEGLPAEFSSDLAKIHGGGRQLLALISEYFDEVTFATKSRNLREVFHELRTPVNHIIGYSEMLQESAIELNREDLHGDLEKIRLAAQTWLALMEEHILPESRDSDSMFLLSDTALGATGLLAPGVSFRTPSPRSVRAGSGESGSLLVVDDDPVNREMLARRLSRRGYDVTLADNGLKAIQLARRHRFDLVLLDLIMPGLDGYQVLAKMKADPALRHIPVIMISALDQEDGIARCIELGAEDYLSKPFNPVFLRARIGACLEKKRLRDKERQTYEALLASQRKLAGELAEAAVYVRSLLPPPIEGDVRARWRFHPSAELGGDIFGYHWIDSERLAIYLLDVSGHGVGAALLSVSVLNLLRAQSLGETDAGEPAQVVHHLNNVFQMENQNNLLFTIWYGVFNKVTREIVFCSGGHPPAILMESGKADRLRELSTNGAVVGCAPGVAYRAAACPVAPKSRLYLFSDGVYEISDANGRTRQLADLLVQLGAPVAEDGSRLDAVVAWAKDIRQGVPLEDDFSMVEFEF